MPGREGGGQSGWVTRRFAMLWLMVAATGAMVAAGGGFGTDGTGQLEIGTARVAFADVELESPTYEGDVELVATYAVDEGQLISDRPVPRSHRLLWSTVTDVIPEPWLGRVRQFAVIDEARGGTVALLHQSGLEIDQWLLSVDRADAGDRSLLADTLVHELAHLVILRSDQFTFAYRQRGVCDGVQIPTGCAAAGSSMARWIEAFWDDRTGPAVYDPDEFVAPYAATAAHEDLAETFLYWMRGEPVGNSEVLAAKFAFFAADPDLGPLRDQLASS